MGDIALQFNMDSSYRLLKSFTISWAYKHGTCFSPLSPLNDSQLLVLPYCACFFVLWAALSILRSWTGVMVTTRCRVSYDVLWCAIRGEACLLVNELRFIPFSLIILEKLFEIILFVSMIPEGFYCVLYKLERINIEAFLSTIQLNHVRNRCYIDPIYQVILYRLLVNTSVYCHTGSKWLIWWNTWTIRDKLSWSRYWSITWSRYSDRRSHLTRSPFWQHPYRWTMRKKSTKKLWNLPR